MPIATDIQISVNSSEIADAVKQSVVGMQVDLVESGIASASFILSQGSGEIDDLSGWLDGASLDIALRGGDVAMTDVFSGEVIGLRLHRRPDGGTELEVRAADKLHRLKRGQAETVYANITDSSLLTKLVQPLGLTGSCTLESITYATIFQPGLTAYELLEDRVTRLGAVMWAEGDTVKIAPERTGAKALTLSMDTDLMSLRMVRTASRVEPGVSVRSWDPAQKAQWLGSAASGDESLVDTTGKAGAAVVKKGFDTGTSPLSEIPVRSKKEADAIAAGLLEDHSLEFSVAHGVTLGLPTLAPGATLTLERVSTSLAGKWRVSRVRHRRDTRGYVTEFEARRNTGGV